MMNKEEIIDLLYSSLDYVYCFNCRKSDENKEWPTDACDYCNRKSMGWEISRGVCEHLAAKILQEEE